MPVANRGVVIHPMFVCGEQNRTTGIIVDFFALGIPFRVGDVGNSWTLGVGEW